MKNLNSIKKISIAGFGFIVFAFFLSSCQKEILPTPDQSGGVQTLKVSSGFDWKTVRDITINVTGLKEVNPEITNTLYVNSVSGFTFFKDNLAMNSDYTIRFSVPAGETSLVLKYGSKAKTLEITSGILTFDYITE